MITQSENAPTYRKMVTLCCLIISTWKCTNIKKDDQHKYAFCSIKQNSISANPSSLVFLELRSKIKERCKKLKILFFLVSQLYILLQPLHSQSITLTSSKFLLQKLDIFIFLYMSEKEKPITHIPIPRRKKYL